MTTPALDLSIIINHTPHIKAMGAYHVAHERTAEGLASVEIALPYDKRLVGYPDTGVVAGGVLYSLMDNASGMAVALSSDAAFQMVATIDLRIDYLKPATPGQIIHAWAECFRLTRRIGFARGLAFHPPSPDSDHARTGRAHPIAVVSGTFVRQRWKGSA